MCVYLTFQTIAKFAIFLFYLVLEKRYTYQPTKHKIQSSLSNYLPTAIPIHLPQLNQPTNQPTIFLFVEIFSIVRCSRICRCLVFFFFRLLPLPLPPLLPLLLSTYNTTTTTILL